MLKQLLIVALVCGVAVSVPTVQAKKKDDAGLAVDAPKKEKKPKKEKEKKEKGDKAPAAKPTEQEVVGTLSVEEKDDKKTYSLETADGTLALRGKKVADLDQWVGKKITLACTGRMMESKKGKSLVITKLGDVSEAQ